MIWVLGGEVSHNISTHSGVCNVVVCKTYTQLPRRYSDIYEPSPPATETSDIQCLPSLSLQKVLFVIHK